MEDKRFVFLIGILSTLLIGCALKLPTGRLVEGPQYDPWTVHSTTVGQAQGFGDLPSNKPIAEKKEKDFELKSESTDSSPKPQTIAVGQSVAEQSVADQTVIDQEKVLSRNDWVKNHELKRWVDNGMKNPNPNLDPVEIKRRAEIFRLNNASSNANDGKNKKRAEIDPEVSVGLSSTWRWLHRDLETLQGTPDRPSAKPYLSESKFHGKRFDVLRTNAAILLGRDGDESAKEPLRQAIRNEGLFPEIRCAAAETLSKLTSTTADDLLDLLDAAREQQNVSLNQRTKLVEQKFNPGCPPLWVELLTALSEKVAPWEQPCFVEAVDARNADVRAEIARIWRLHPPPSPEIVLPPKFLKFVAEEQETLVRIEILRALGAWKHQDLLPLVRTDLHRVVQVRGAAMDAIADVNCRDAIPLIREKLDDPAAWNRAKAVSTLRKLGELDDVFRKKDDDAWEVLVEVAQALATERTPKGIELAKNYLGKYPKVQAATLEAIAVWPIEESGPLLIEAMKGSLPATRQRAKELLKVHWNDVDDFNAADTPAHQTAQYAEMSRRFEEFLKTRGSSPVVEMDRETVQRERKPNAKPLDGLQLDDLRKTLDDLAKPGIPLPRRRSLEAKLESVGERLVPTLEMLYFDERRKIPESLDTTVLAKVDPVFAQIAKLHSENGAERRRAAVELLQRADEGIGRFALVRIYERSLRLHDQFELNPILQTLEKADESGDFACELARRLIDSQYTELRRRSCEVLKKRGNGDDIPLLTDRLTDQSVDVVRIALEAIADIVADSKPNEFLAEKKNAAELLSKKLPTLDPYLQADTAATLYRLGNPNGIDTLKRLSFSKEIRIRIYVARKLGGLDGSDCVSILLDYLKEEGAVRQAALESLPQLVGDDIGAVETDTTRSRAMSDTQKRVARWEAWAESRRR